MSDWNFPGARWWKFDFHTHTPASNDFLKGCSQEEKKQVTPEVWLRKFMEKEIDCVAITDHNSGKWIDELKSALDKIKTELPEWYRSIYLFPGVEISVHGGVHLLAIFSPEKGTNNINELLGAVEYQGTRGTSDGVTKKSLTSVVDCVSELGGIAIPAHVDKPKGLFENVHGNTLQQALDNHNINAIETCVDEYEKPQLYKNSKLNWTEVRGSDTHNFSSAHFGDFTWVKMDEPTIEGLKLALIDGPASVDRDLTSQPNEHAEFVIESIEVEDAQYMGRGRATALKCELSPFLNTIIGGRGSGKSTLLEFMRFSMRRKDELPEHLQNDYRAYFSTEPDGLLTPDSHLRLVYRKGDTRYRLNWSADPQGPSLEECDGLTDEWQGIDGDIPSLFPARIYSQKQIFELAKDPQGLLGIIDEEPSVKYEEYQKAFQDCANKAKVFNQQWHQLKQEITEESKLKGQLNDLTRQIKQVEKSGHKKVLRSYQLRQQQLNEIEQVEQHWQILLENMGEVIAEADVASVDKEVFVNHPDILNALNEKQQEWKAAFDLIRKEVKKISDGLQQWQQDKMQQGWMKTLKMEQQQYERLHARFQEMGIDPQTYPDLLRRYALAEKELRQIQEYKKRKEELSGKYKTEVKQAKDHRIALTERRINFLKTVLVDKELVQITVNDFSESWVDMKEKITEILQTGGRFERDINDLENLVNEEQGWEKIKQRIIDIRQNKASAKDSRFQTHLQELPTESLIDLRLWFPEDAVQVTYGKDSKNISEGSSPGQKSAALLGFILNYGDEPLLLDQPEDDLDNELIYTLIVQSIRATKAKRQIIVVTHNPNIVVNGNSEMVHCFNIANGQSHIQSGSLQSKDIREHICTTMEGGREAFEQRYKRIHLED